jgi:hypothetical protein
MLKSPFASLAFALSHRDVDVAVGQNRQLGLHSKLGSLLVPYGLFSLKGAMRAETTLLHDLRVTKQSGLSSKESLPPCLAPEGASADGKSEYLVVQYL